MPSAMLTRGDLPKGPKKFKTFAYVTRAYEDAKGDWWIHGVASGPALDAHGERMAPECVESMNLQINSGQVRLLRSHYDDWDMELGYLKAGKVDLAGELEVDIWIDKEMPEAQKLWRKLHGVPEKGIEPSKLGLSIGGWLVDASGEIADGEYVFTIRDLSLDHVAVTSMPAYPNAWIDDAEVKQKEFARPWLRDIAKAAGDQWKARTVKGGEPMPPDELEEMETDAAPAEEAKESDAQGGDVGKDSEDGDDLVGIFEAIKSVAESVAALKAALPPVKLMRANDLIGDEYVLVKDEESEAEEAEEDDDDEEPADDEGESDDPAEKSAERSGDVLKTKSQRLRELLHEERAKNAKLQKQIEGKGGRTEGQRRGLHASDADDEVGKARNGEGEGQDSKQNWVETLKSTEAWKSGNRTQRVELLKMGLPKEVKKHYDRLNGKR